jgi:hypothetical protein
LLSFSKLSALVLAQRAVYRSSCLILLYFWAWIFKFLYCLLGSCLIQLFALQPPRRFPLEPAARRVWSRCVCPACRSAPRASCPFSGSHLECCSLHIASSGRFYRSSRELARSAEDVPSRRFLLNLAPIPAQRAASFSSYHRSVLPPESLLVYTFVQFAHSGLQF